MYFLKNKINNEEKITNNNDIKKKNKFNTILNKEISAEKKRKKN